MAIVYSQMTNTFCLYSINSIILPLLSPSPTSKGGNENMNVVMIIFYVVCLTWLLGLGVFSLVKYIKAKRQVKDECKDIENKKDTD